MTVEITEGSEKRNFHFSERAHLAAPNLLALDPLEHQAAPLFQNIS